jgi:thiol-disulfide isomerase/thioredoxin
MLRFWTFIVFFPLVCSANGLGQESQKNAAEQKFLTDFRLLRERTDKQIEAVYAQFRKEIEDAKTDAEFARVSSKVDQQSIKIVQPAVKQALDQILPHAADRAAVEPLLWVAEFRRQHDPALVAVELLQKHHLTDAKTIAFAIRSRHDLRGWVEPLLRAQLGSVELAKEQRPRVLFTLADHLQTLAMASTQLADADADVAQYVETFGRDRVEALKNLDPAKLNDEAIRHFTGLLQKHANEEIVPGEKLGTLAKAAIFEIKHLSVGKTVPDIDGEDLDGVNFKLSDYRGKVVLLSFWGSWCGPCMALVPQERELMEKYKGRPFALVGVNSDPDKVALQKVLKEQKITWRSFWCGKDGPDGELPRSWNINGWPTAYLIDHAGVIRGKHLYGSALDTKIRKLVSEVEKSNSPKN